MKKFFTILFLGLLLGYTGWAQVKIGLPAGAAQSSAVLDLSNSGDGTRGLIIPRVATTNAVLLPAQGMLVYDISSNSMKGYENGTWISYSTQTPAVGVNCTATTLNGLYTQTMALTAANTMIVTVVNNSFSAVTITPSLSDVVLSGTGAPGMTVASYTPSTVTPGSGGGTATITYTFSGTPTTVGSFTATWTKLSLTCAKTTNVCLAIAPITVSNTTTPSTLPLTTVAGNTVDFTAAGGTPNTGLTWVMSSYPTTGIFSNATTGTGAAAQAVLVAGASGNITVTYTAVNACGLQVTGTQTANVNPLYVNCATSAINGIFYQNFPLNATNNITMQVVNNGNAATTVTPTTANIVFSGTAGISLSGATTSSASIPANGGTATLTYTLSGTPTSLGAFSASWTNQVLACVVSSTVTCPTTSAVTVSNTTSPATLPATIVAGSTINFTAAGGTPTSGLTWSMTSNPSTGVFSSATTGTGATASAVLVAGTGGTVTITYTAANGCSGNKTGTQSVTFGCQNDISVGSGTIVQMSYDNTGSGTANYAWCARTVVGPDGLTWLDRNLGASKVATSSTDALSFGSLYQWGRNTDGHQIAGTGRGVDNAALSTTTPTLANTNTPGNVGFIIINSGNNDWRSDNNTNRWNNVTGTGASLVQENNPCPSGYHVPTNAQQVTLASAWTNTGDAYASSLRLSVPGWRWNNDGSFAGVSQYGYYWSGTPSGVNALSLSFSSVSIHSSDIYNRAFGFTVRCVKN